MLLKIMQALVTLPRRGTKKSTLWMASQHLMLPVNFEPKVNNGDRAIPLPTSSPPFQELRTGLHTVDLSALAISCKSSGASSGYQGALFRLKSVLPDCRNGTIMEPHTAHKIILPQKRFSSIIHRHCGHFWQQSVEPVYPDIKLSALSCLNICITWLNICSTPLSQQWLQPRLSEVWFSYPLYHYHVQTLPNKRGH